MNAKVWAPEKAHSHPLSLATTQGFCNLSLKMSQQTVEERNCASKLITTHLPVLSFRSPNLEFNNSRPHFVEGEPAFHEIVKSKTRSVGSLLPRGVPCPSLPLPTLISFCFPEGLLEHVKKTSCGLRRWLSGYSACGLEFRSLALVEKLSVWSLGSGEAEAGKGGISLGLAGQPARLA